MKKVLLIVIMILLCFTAEGLAATLINDNFDSILNVPGNAPPAPWVVDNHFTNYAVTVNNSTSFSPPNSVAVTVTLDPTGTPGFGQSHANITGTGTYEAYLRTNNVDNETLVMFSHGDNGSSNGAGFWISLGGPAGSGISSGHLAYYDGSVWHDIMAISNDTWYHVRVVVNVPAKTFDIYVDNMTTPLVTGASFEDTGVTNLNSINFNVFGSNYNPNPSVSQEDYAYVDNVLVTVPDPAAVPTMTEWGMIIFVVLAGAGAVSYLRRSKTLSVSSSDRRRS